MHFVTYPSSNNLSIFIIFLYSPASTEAKVFTEWSEVAMMMHGFSACVWLSSVKRQVEEAMGAVPDSRVVDKLKVDDFCSFVCFRNIVFFPPVQRTGMFPSNT